MIGFFRKNRRGVVGTFIIGMCSLLMLPFGMDYFGNQGGGQTAVASVGDEEITAIQYDQALYQYRTVLKRQFKENYEKIAAMINVKQKVLDDLIDERLLNSVIADAGLEVGRTYVKSFIQKLPVFADGFSVDKFRSFIKSQGLTERELEGRVKDAVVREQFENILGIAATVSPKELERRYRLSNQEVVLAYTKVESIGKNPVVSDAEIKEFYDKNKDTFLTEREYSLAIARVPVANFRESVRIHDEDIQDAYKKNRHQFRVPAKVKFEQISFQKEAPDFLSAEIKAPVNLDILAKATREELVKAPETFKEVSSAKGGIYKMTPEFVEVSSLPREVQLAVADLPIGEVSEVLSASDRFYIVKNLDYTPETQKPIEEVRAELEDLVRSELAPDLAAYNAEEIKDKVSLVDNENVVSELKKIATEKKLEFLEASGTVLKLPTYVSGKLAAKTSGEVFTVNEDETINVVYILGIKQPEIKSLEQTKEEIVAHLKEEKRNEGNKELAKNIIISARNAGRHVTYNGFLQIAGKYSLDFTDVSGDIQNVNMPFLLQGDGRAQEIISEVITEGLVKKPVEGMDGSVYLVLLKSIKEKETDNLKKEIAKFESEERELVIRRVEDLLLDSLKKEKNIEVNSRLVDTLSQ